MTDAKAAEDHYDIRMIDPASQAFSDILTLRSSAYGREEAGRTDAIDLYSRHFAAFADGQMVGCVRVTLRSDGPLESEQFYPLWLMREFGEQMSAVSRLCVSGSVIGLKVPHALTRAAWRWVLPMGIRIDVSKARLKAIPFYLKMGHYYIRNSLFDFQHWKAKCGLVACPVDSQRPSIFRDIFEDACLPCKVYESQHAAMFTQSMADVTSDLHRI